ncbi:hypothetical protein M878_01720 [Streptomyces roseochromogenus subsp. oscitans DS 12.976]|uniref:Glyceraldehyde 3-phosphate dehydrogenase NAD(P) binding domain-containing protein n=1 Tax=Streptomyces roseochromogenus subsp. oscitans DS 12.976 TaxID=1352936 RepID=V6KWX7_STRRC|nr:hypothetical protein M878_01720 [Streptomyces roseochromogenus subsp. oscitans DS 12.976]
MTVRVGINGFGRFGRTHLRAYDSTSGDGRRINVTAGRDPAALHLKTGAHTVLPSAPGKDVDASIVMGVNEDTHDRHRDRIISAA